MLARLSKYAFANTKNSKTAMNTVSKILIMLPLETGLIHFLDDNLVSLD